jgi:putative tricarboxylic transport membrane protein
LSSGGPEAIASEAERGAGNQGDRGNAVSRPWWLGLAVIAIGCVCLYGAMGLPQGARYAAVGPGMFVTGAGGGLVILGVILLVQIARGERFEPQDAEDATGSERADPRALGLAFVAALVPIFTIDPLGLPITALISFVLVARAFGSKRLLLDMFWGAALGCLAWLLFSRLGLQLGGFLPIAGL